MLFTVSEPKDEIDSDLHDIKVKSKRERWIARGGEQTGHGAFHCGGLNVTSVFCYVVTSFSQYSPLPALILCVWQRSIISPALVHKDRSHQQGRERSERVCFLFLMSIFWVTREGLSQLLSIDWLESIDQAVSSASRERKRERVTTESKKTQIEIERERGQKRKEKGEKATEK